MRPPIDFQLLSMTELRTRPGEIFDRVADDGEAFIIEKGGRRKACLVPLSVFVPDISPSRIASEMEELATNGEVVRVEITPERELALCFTCDAAAGERVQVKMVLPHGYPSACPRVFAELDEAASPPHRWQDGSLCLYGVMTGWNPGRHTAQTTLNLTRQWLTRYASWRRDGVWPTARGEGK